MDSSRVRVWLFGIILVTNGHLAQGRIEFDRDFAPSEGWTKPAEQPYRQDICLNGRWQFQPVPLPTGWKRDAGVAPELPVPAGDKWESTPIKIPSPWNVNTWGSGPDAGEGTGHPYWPGSKYYPSYPDSWNGVEMAWLRRTFKVPGSWKDKRILLHFEAVGGHAQIFVNGRNAGENFDRYMPFELDINALVNRDGENELLVGVRSMRLFDKKSSKYKRMRTPYPPGSNTDKLSGIWQDVFLVAVPAVRVTDVFIKPWVDRDLLEAEISVRNDSTVDQAVEIGGAVQPWVNLAGKDVLDAPEPKWRLDASVMNLPVQMVALKAGETKQVVLGDKAGGRLKFWSPETPNLYGMVICLKDSDGQVDRRYERFGWRQFKIAGKDFLLNGKKIRMYGDFMHPFGPFINSRRYVWAWYTMIRDMHGNAIRPHAQPHPRHYLDLADEMGLLLLDETAMFGSSIQLNFEEPEAWDRYAEQYDRLILRDRNHPSVFGWSWGNELFAIFIYDKAITKEQADEWYRKMGELGNRGRRLDPTRDWISCDGDEDVRGTMPVWNKHFGHNLPPAGAIPNIDKPLMIGESGGTYYAKPGQLAVFNGDRAYESYEGRNEALAIDVYENIVKLARPKLTFYSPAETAWFGIEHLNLGYNDFTRLPRLDDGIWLKPFEEGKPGVQPERIPPYVCTFNPGWDSSLPLYKPLAMFEAQKAAQDPAGPRPCKWDRKQETKKPEIKNVKQLVCQVGFAGDRKGSLFKRLKAIGVPVADAGQACELLVVDADSLSDAQAQETKKNVDATLSGKGTVLVMFRKPGEICPAAGQLLPKPVALTSHKATALVSCTEHSWIAGFSAPELYFAEDITDKHILKCGLDGELVKGGKVLLTASNIDWSQFNQQPEFAKCAATILYEKLVKPSGAALVAVEQGGGTLVLSSIDYAPDSQLYTEFWWKLFSGMGVSMKLPGQISSGSEQKKEHDLLLDGPVNK